MSNHNIMTGGKRDGAGRPAMPLDQKKIPVNVRLRPWLVEWMREQDESQAALIEEALVEKHGLIAPD